MAGIKETTEMVNLIVALTVLIKNASADGKVDAADLTLLIGVLPHLNGAISGINEIPAELKDLQQEEVEAISESVGAIIGDLAGDKYEDIADHAIRAGFEIVEIVKLFKS